MIPLTKDQALVITAYTGVMFCKFHDFHEFVENKLQRAVWTHEMGTKEFWEEIKLATKQDALVIAHYGDHHD